MSRIIQDGYEPDTNKRVLSIKKQNYGETGNEIGLTWQEGIFVPDAVETNLDRMAAGAKAERVFLKLRDKFAAQERFVSASPSSAYVPSIFAKHPEAEGQTKRSLASAMESLFGRGVIEVAEHGKGAKARKHIARKGVRNDG